MTYDKTVTEIKIPQEKLDAIQKILSANCMSSIKKDMLLALSENSIKPICCVCGGVSSPLYQVRYSGPEVVRLEVYCSTHVEGVYQKTKDSTSEELAERYNCQIGVPNTLKLY